MEIVLALTTTLTLLNTLLIIYLRHHISDLRHILHELDITYWKDQTSLKIDLNKKIQRIKEELENIKK